jgi:hypothetical protein
MQINFLAVLVAALSSFLLGGVWYRVFGPAWQRAQGGTATKEGGHPARVFGLSFLFSLVAALGYAILLPLAPTVGAAAVQGLLVGACLVAASFGINYQFANRSLGMWLIDGGYHTLQFGIFGQILGAWR